MAKKSDAAKYGICPNFSLTRLHDAAYNSIAVVILVGKVTTSAIKTSLDDVLARVEKNREKIFIVRRGKAIAYIAPVEDSRASCGKKLTPTEIMRLPRPERRKILSSAVTMAEEEYRGNPDLTDFQEFDLDE